MKQNRYYLHFEVNGSKFWQTTFIAQNSEYLLQIAIKHATRIIKETMPDIDAENAIIEIKQFSFLGEISETESQKAPLKQIEPLLEKQSKLFVCECGAKFQTVQARSGHKKGCKI